MLSQNERELYGDMALVDPEIRRRLCEEFHVANGAKLRSDMRPGACADDEEMGSH